MRAVVTAYHEFGADSIVCESNQGGDYLDAALKMVDPMLTIRKVHAMRGKFIRAEPIAMLAEQQRLHHAGSAAEFEALEDQLCSITKDGDRSAMADDRADAYVWAFTELKGLTQGSFLSAYGLAKCDKCEAVLKKNSLICPGCGDKREPAFDKDAYIHPEHSDRRWAEAYAKKCEECSNPYPRNLLKCPECRPGPEKFLQALGNLTGTNTGWRPGEAKGIWKRGWRRG
jgi:Terminase RNaseH-like domain